MRLPTIAAALVLLVPAVNAHSATSPTERAARACTRGFHQLESARVEAARASFTRALELAPDLPEAVEGLGRTELAERRYADALPLLQRAGELYSARAGLIAGEQLEVATDLDRVRRDLAAYGLNGGPCSGSMRLHHSLTPREVFTDGDDPLPAGLRFRIGVCLLRLGRTGEAREAFRAELAAHPDTPAAHVNLAVCELALGDAGAAQAELREARRLNTAIPGGLEAAVREALR